MNIVCICLSARLSVSVCAVLKYSLVCFPLCKLDPKHQGMCRVFFHTVKLTHTHSSGHPVENSKSLPSSLGQEDCVVMLCSVSGLTPSLSVYLTPICLSVLSVRFIVNQSHLLTALARRPLALSFCVDFACEDKRTSADMTKMVGCL